MALEALSIWRSTFNALPAVTTSAWIANFVGWTGARTTNLMELANITSSVFTFDEPTFTTELTNNAVITTNLDAALQVFVDAWGTAVLSSTMVVTGGTGFGKTDIQATGSVSNISSAKSQLKTDLLAGGLTADSNTSVFPPAFRDAFLALVYSVTGDSLNPSPPPTRIAFSESDGTK